MTVPDPIGGNEPITSQQIYAELRQYTELGVIEFVLPTEPLGAEWVLGARGQILKLIGDDQAAAFLAGASVMAHWVEAQTRATAVPPGLRRVTRRPGRD